MLLPGHDFISTLYLWYNFPTLRGGKAFLGGTENPRTASIIRSITPAPPGHVHRGAAMIQIRHKSTGAVLLEVDSDTLAGAKLSGAKLQGASLQGLDLRGAIIDNADLRDADLRGANLVNATFNAAALDS